MSATRQIHNLALIGFMGTGKSSVGRFCASALRFELIDTDQVIEQRAGRSIPEIFADQGQEAFREMERQLVAEMAGWQRSAGLNVRRARPLRTAPGWVHQAAVR